MASDLTKCSFEEFVTFLFDRSVPLGEDSFAALARHGETDKWNPWYYDCVVWFEPTVLCGHYSRLFREPQLPLDRFSKAQLEQGFWAAQSPTLDCSAYHLVWNREVSFDFREECIRSMYFLFRDLFFDEPLQDSVCMWWDSFCYGWHCGSRKRSCGGEDLLLQDVMFETLSQILALESDICQGAALHGLSHLHHPRTGKVIEAYISKHPLLSEEWKDAAGSAARFGLM
jgi:hypothetical protein